MFAEAIVIIAAVVLAQAGPPVTLAFGGDVMLGRVVNATIREHGARYVWGGAASGSFPGGSSTFAETRAWRRR
jgi:hypothetical protein